MVLGEETGKQDAVPVLVGTLFHEMPDPLTSRTWLALVTELSAVSAQPEAQATLILRHVRVRLMVAYSERFQRGASAGLGHGPRVSDGAFKLSSKLGR